MCFKKTYPILLFVCFVSFSSVYGQNSLKRFAIGGFGGMGIPIGPPMFQDDYRLSPGVGMDFMYNFSNYTSVYFDLTFQQFHFDDGAVKKEIEDTFGELGSVFDIEDGTMHLGVISIDLLQYFCSPNRRFRFYFLIGGGITIRKADNIGIKGLILNYQYDSVDTLNSETSFGLNGGMGLTLILSDYMHLFVQGQYHHVFSDDFELWNPEIFAVEDTGKRLSFICLKTGLRFHL